MTGNCAVFFLWSACDDKGAIAGSIPEWLTAIVAAFALAAAVYAGRQAKKAADSADDQARAATAALRIDARSREEAQARLVYSLTKSFVHYPPGKLLVRDDGHERRTAWDPEALTAWRKGTNLARQEAFARNTTRDTILVTIEVRNGSLEIITDVYMYMVNPHAQGVGGRHAKSAEGHAFSALLPHASETFTIAIPLPESTHIDPRNPQLEEHIKDWIPVIEFRDSSGVWWARPGASRIRKVIRAAEDSPGVGTFTELYPEPEIEIP